MLKFCIVALISFHHVRAIVDLSKVCNGIADNDDIAHPFDCQAYFHCSKMPEIHYCANGLHFDSARKVCDLPEVAKCKLANDMIEQFVSPFIALDAETGRATHPLHKFNPKHVECVHFGAYFLPHPQLCNQYYICAYGHLHKHSCGRDTLWHYEREQCESASNAICYANAHKHADMNNQFENDQSTTATYEGTVCYPIYTTALPFTSSTSNVPTSTLSAWSTTRKLTPDATTTTTHTSTSTRNPTGSTPNFESSTMQQQQMNSVTSITKTTATTWFPTGSTLNFEKKEQNPEHTSKNITTKLPVTTSSFDSNDDNNNNRNSSEHPTPGTPSQPTPPTPSKALVTPPALHSVITTKRTITNCPDSRQAYLPHPNDCSKYYICILGKAVLTSCPHGLYWDHTAESCDKPENVRCINA